VQLRIRVLLLRLLRLIFLLLSFLGVVLTGGISYRLFGEGGLIHRRGLSDRLLLWRHGSLHALDHRRYENIRVCISISVCVCRKVVGSR
jgi:hypothetical protein